MALISQIFLHSNNQQSDETEPKQQQSRKYLIHLEKKTSTYKRDQIKYNKNAAPP
jgi:hypothetical protein